MITLGSASTGEKLEPAALLHSLLKASTEHALVATDLAGRILVWNEGATRLYGYSPEDVAGKSLFDLAPRDSLPAELPGEIAAAVAEHAVWEGTLSAVRPDTTEVTARVTVTPRRDPSGAHVGFLIIAKDKSAELEELTSKMRTLLGAVVEDREADRRRVAGEIHDDTVQIMTAIAYKLHAVGAATADSDIASVCAVVGGEVETAIQRLRGLIFELHPPSTTDRSVRQTLEVALEEAAAVGNFDGNIRGRPSGAPSEAHVSLIYRIAREALSNVARHAGARKVNLVVQDFADGLIVQIRDNGSGFDVAARTDLPGHLGLRGMREHAEAAGGWLEIRSVLTQGTMVEFWVPLQPKEPQK